MQIAESTDRFQGDLVFAVKLGASIIVSSWARTSYVIQCLVILMVVDIITGIISAYIEKTLSSTFSFRGMLKKVIILLLVSVAEFFSLYLRNVGVDMGIDGGRVCALFYIVGEVISIVENSARCGILIPSGLLAALAKVKDTQGASSSQPKK